MGMAVLGFCESSGQDNHYETVPIGTVNSLLYGSALSNRVDRSAVVVNPATLAFPGEQGSGISFNGLTFNYNFIDFQDALGPGRDIGVQLVNTLPGILAGDVQTPLFGKRQAFGYALYQRGIGRIIYSGLSNAILDADPGGELIGRYNLLSDLRETVGVFGSGYRVSEHWGIGFSIFGIYRNHLFVESAQFDWRQDDSLASYNAYSGIERDVKILQASVQLKGGVNWKSDPWSAGLTLTLPGFSVYRDGKMGYERREWIQESDSGSNFLISALEDDLDPRYRYPWSVALGVSRSAPKWTVSLALNYESALDPYVIIPEVQADIIRNQGATSGFEPGETEVWGGNRSLLNWSISASKTLSNDLQLLASVRSNLSFAYGSGSSSRGFRLERMNWNMYHLNLGAHYEWRNTEWIFGTQLSYGGRATAAPNSDSDPLDLFAFLQNLTAQGDVHQYGAALIVSFALNFDESERALRPNR